MMVVMEDGEFELVRFVRGVSEFKSRTHWTTESGNSFHFDRKIPGSSMV